MGIILVVGSSNLILEGIHFVRYETVETEFVSFLFLKRGTFVQIWCLE